MNPLDFIGAHLAVAAPAHGTGEAITLKATSTNSGAGVIVTLYAHQSTAGEVRTGNRLYVYLNLAGTKTAEDAFPFTLADVLAAGVSPEAGRKGAYQLLWLLMRRDAAVREWVAAEAPRWWSCVRDAVGATP